MNMMIKKEKYFFEQNHIIIPNRTTLYKNIEAYFIFKSIDYIVRVHCGLLITKRRERNV